MSTFIEQELKYQEDPIEELVFQTKKKTCKSILCGQFAKGILIALLFAITLPTIAYYIVISGQVNQEEVEQFYCLIQEEYRVPCGHVNISQYACEAASCCFNTTTEQCHHFLPSKYFFKNDENLNYIPSIEKSPYGSKSVPSLQFTVQEKSADKLSLVIHDSSETIEKITAESKNYTINQSTKKLILEVLDKDGDIIFSTAKGPLIASDFYWEWAFQLSTETIFGLDRSVITLSGNETFKKAIYKSQADHSTLPVFWAYQNGKFHGCVIKHDGPLEIEILASNMIILRSLLGKKLEIELSLGSSPAQLYQQQAGEIVVPPLWTLGTHNCRTSNTVNLKNILKVYADNKDSTFDTDCLHKNLFMALQLTNNTAEDLTEFETALQEMVASGTKFLLSLPPHIIVNDLNPLYTAAKEQDIVYKYQSGIVYNSTYFDQTVVYPDYSDEHIDKFVQILIDWVKTKFGVDNISGFVLNDNWPQDDKYDNVEKVEFAYYSEELDTLMKYTLPWTLNGSDGRLHLEKHNSYGSFQYSALQSYLKSTTDLSNAVVITSTKNFGDAAPEISDNFATSWDNFRMYLNTITFNSITGNLMVGLPVCGDAINYNKQLQETLCLRWYIAAATMPYFQVSSGNPFRDPANLYSRFATQVADLAMNRRKFLLDYFYTILNDKVPLVRPMYYDYYRNTTTFTMDSQYTIGSEIIIAQPLSIGKIKLQVYLPPEIEHWYEFWGGTMFTPQSATENIVDVDILETDWAMFIAQGHIVALTDATQIDLYIALDCSSDCTAVGDLYKDDTRISFTATDTSVTISNLPVNCGYTIGYLRVYGYHGATGYIERYDKNVPLCDTTTNTVTVNYLDGV